MTTISSLFGLLLMTFPGPPLDASGSHHGSERMLTDFTSISSDLGWYVVNDNVTEGTPNID